MRILVTNDDGIEAPGLDVLEALARELSDDVWVCAPTEEQSGSGHSLTLIEPVRIRKLGEKRYAVRGTPTDCVMMAVSVVLKDHKPDLLLSGVNRGANLAEDVTYSGTVSAAMEGTLAGVRSIALSQVITDWRAADPYGPAKAWGAHVIRAILGTPHERGVLYNVNFTPVAASAVKGVKTTEQGFHDYSRSLIEERRDLRGTPYYWFGLGPDTSEPGHETDLKAMAEGCISVTPLHLDLTHHASLGVLRGAVDGLTLSSREP